MPDADEWRCGGELVPPTGWQQDTAFEDSKTPNARELASQKAAEKLVRRLCQSDTDCASLAASIRPWKTGANGVDVCAMAVVSESDWTAWKSRTTPLEELDTKLDVASQELLAGQEHSARVAIDQVRDGGVPGGERADWLRSRMESALQRRALVSDVPKGWAGHGIPSGIDVIVRCDIVSRQEHGVAMLETNWVAIDRSGKRTRCAPVTLAESAAPQSNVRTQSAFRPDDDSISVRVDAMRGGSLCAGDTTQIWLRTTQPLHIRVLDLYGEDGAVLIYPNDDQRQSLILANQTVALGGRTGFRAIPVPGHDEEQFLVLGATAESLLGPFGKLRGACRLSPRLARELHAGRGVPSGVKAATTGYRLLSAKNCSNGEESRERVRAETLAALQSLPSCGI